ncbi:MAG: SIS domain-containing protein [Rhizobiaceae bacterium]|nr:SIS domain-containing protein [Rhizobiaceae bacterium]
MNAPDSNSSETYESLRSRIRDRFDELSPHLQRIARTALSEPNFFALNTVAVLAEHVDVQPSTLIRFAKEFGYRGFTQLQRVFRLRLIEGTADKRAAVYDDKIAHTPAMDMGHIFDGCVDELIASLEAVRKSTDRSDLSKAVSIIQKATHIHVAGLRRARPIATYLAYGISRSELHCSLLDFGGGMAEQQVANMAYDDLLICISFPPYTPMVLDVARDAHLRKRTVIAITDSKESPLALNSSLSFVVDIDAASQFKPISGAIALVQAICVGLVGHG